MRVEREWGASGARVNRRNEAQKRGRSGETERERSASGARVEREWSASGAHGEKAERLRWGGDQPSKGERENQMKVGLSRAGWRKRKR